MSRILVIDDDSHQVRALATRLEAAGFDVLAVDSAHKATELIFGFRPDVAVLDIDMPAYSGLEFHAMLRNVARGRDIPVVYLTGSDSWLHRQQARLQNAFAFLSKPYEPHKLLSVINDALTSASSKRMSCREEKCTA